jgi:CheY-like chemotaxis protein
MGYAGASDTADATRITLLDVAHEQPTILVVEDEILVRAMIADELRDQGYRVIEATQADDALAVLRSGVPVELVLTDVQMPGPLDGLGLARLIRADYPAIKVIIASGRVRGTAIEAGASAFFAKPYDVGALVTAIYRLLADEAIAEPLGSAR